MSDEPTAARLVAVIPNEVIEVRLSLEQRAAIAEYERQLVHAWQAGPEFGSALNLAITIGVTKPLRDYAAAGKPIPHDTVFVAGKSVPMKVLVAELLGGQALPQSSGGGRPRRVAGEAKQSDQAERNAAWLVAFMQRDWRQRHGRKRVPRIKTNAMIRTAIAEAAKAFKVPVNAIDARNIENLLKTGRVVVRNWG
jgi:hypothetical protein